MNLRGLLCACLALAAVPAAAIDRWEYRGDDAKYTTNELQPGVIQEAHDLESTPEGPDEDWYLVHCQEVRSYEARVFGGGIIWKYAACPDCADFDRVDPTGVVLTPGDSDTTLGSPGRSVRWIAGPGVAQRLRVKPGAGTPGIALEKYDILLIDTSLFLPRFNNAGSQRSVLIVQNTRDQPVEGQVAFFDAAGNRLHIQPFTLSYYGSLVLDTASIPALQGRAGSAIVAHTGGQAALTGKGVTVDPATGFTFDTPLAGVPR